MDRTVRVAAVQILLVFPFSEGPLDEGGGRGRSPDFLKTVRSAPAGDHLIPLLVGAGVPLMPPGAIAYPVALRAGEAFREIDARWFGGRVAEREWTNAAQVQLVNGGRDLREKAHGVCCP